MKFKLLRNNIIRIILVILIIFWMMVIFGFSAADGTASRSTSDIITEIIIDNFYSQYDGMTIEGQEKLWNQVSFVVRKVGHFGEYAILAVLVSMFMMTFEGVKKNKRMLFVAVLFSVAYAITDEVHQGFVDGRSPKLMDVFIDCAGAVCGTIFVMVVSAAIGVCRRRITCRTTD